MAALVWYTGGAVLLFKGGSLLGEAQVLRPTASGPWLAAMVALLIGGLKARFLFSRSCKKNLSRIAALDQPRIWQFFKPTFFVFLLLMILAGATLSTIAHGHYIVLLAIATLDLTIGVALIGSSYVFWRKYD